MDPVAVIDRVKADGATLQARTEFGLHSVLVSLRNGRTWTDAVKSAGVAARTAKDWRMKYPTFDMEVRRLLAENKKVRQELRKQQEQEQKQVEGLVLPFTRTVPEPVGLADFRWNYFGQPTPLHLEAATLALEDLTNNYVFIFGPTGMGKDTLAGQYALWRQCPDPTGLKVCTVMKVGEKAIRRQRRFGRFLTDPSVYREAPERTPDGQTPSRSLIEDYGPFKWEPGMEWEDGSEVSRLPWNTDGYYFLYAGGGAEADPNWQAVGLEGAIQGDRIDEAILSDIFDLQNQQSPTERRKQLNWLNGILHSRLDSAGRLVVIGNWMHVPHNYEEILANYTMDAVEVERQQIGPSTYVKYDNGVAVVIIKAIYTDEDDVEHSYWPERFPLDDPLVSPDGTEIRLASTVTADELREFAAAGWRRERGLRATRAKDPVIFRAMYQQERDPDVAFADFDDATLDAAMDDLRSFGQIRSGEIRILSVDPARRYGAGWILWAVDRTEQTLTVADFGAYSDLGYTGILNQLILKPLDRYEPSWLCYEDNREGAALADPLIQKAIKANGVGVLTHGTGAERASREIGPGALAAEMRGGVIRIPNKTAEDKARALQLRSHFKAWDINPERSKAGRPGHEPDDLAMAAWIGWLLKARSYLERKRYSGLIVGVPDAVRRRFIKSRQQASGAKTGRETLPARQSPLDAIRAFGGED